MNDALTFAEASGQMADGMGRICRLYGVAPLAGRLYAALFLATRPLALDELVAQTGAAKSSVSVALRKLVGARVARRLPARLDRRDFYEAITDPWAVMAQWNTLYFQRELDMFRDTGAAIEAALDAADGPAPEEALVLRERLAAFREFAEVIGSLLRTVDLRRGPAAPARRIPIVIEGSES